MSRTFQFAQTELQITIVNPRDRGKHFLIFDSPDECNNWSQSIQRASSTWLRHLKSIRGSQTNLSLSWSRPQEYLVCEKKPKERSVQKKLEQNELTPSEVIALDTQFSISTAVPVSVEGLIDLVYSINIIQQFGNRTIMRRLEDFQCLYDSLKNINVYEELPLFPPLEPATNDVPCQSTIQQQCRSLELFLNELALLQPPILQNSDTKGFFEDESDGTIDSGDGTELDVDIVDNAFLRCSMTDIGYMNDFHDSVHIPNLREIMELQEKDVGSL